MSKTIFIGGFKSNKDIWENFVIGDDQLENLSILFAAYDNEDYNACALVVYKTDDKLYLVEASHCSCYGLEQQWDPEEVCWGVLARMNISKSTSYAEEFNKFVEINMQIERR